MELEEDGDRSVRPEGHKGQYEVDREAEENHWAETGGQVCLMHGRLCLGLKGEICSDDRNDVMICCGSIAIRNTWGGYCTGKG